MRRSYVESIATAATALLSFIVTLLNAPVLVTAILGIALFISLGYVLAKVFFSNELGNFEKALAGTGMALAVPVLGGLALQAAGISLNRMAWVSLLVGVTLAGDIVLVWRRVANPVALGGNSKIRIRFKGWHVVIFGAAIVIAAGAVTVASLSATYQRYPGFTQFWLSAHKNATLASLGVANQQGSTKHYRLVLLRKGRPSSIWNLTLSNGQTWQRTISISNNYATSADLYLLPDLTHPYRRVSTSNKAPQL